jgi:hypothetical protein
VDLFLEATANFFKAGKENPTNTLKMYVASLDDASAIPYSNDTACFPSITFGYYYVMLD